MSDSSTDKRDHVNAAENRAREEQKASEEVLRKASWESMRKMSMESIESVESVSKQSVSGAYELQHLSMRALYNSMCLTRV